MQVYDISRHNIRTGNIFLIITVCLSALYFSKAEQNVGSFGRFYHNHLVEPCQLPTYIQKRYFSRENGLNTFTDVEGSRFLRHVVTSIASAIIDTSATKNEMSEEVCLQMQCNRPSKQTGKCQSINEHGNVYFDSDKYRVIVRNVEKNSYKCREIAVRTINILEIRDSEWHIGSQVPAISTLCKALDLTSETPHRRDQHWITLFSMNPTPVSCRSSIEGVWKFTYSVAQYSTHKCSHPISNLTSCPDPGNRFSTENRFYISYGACSDYSWKKDDPGLLFTKDTVMTFVCLGDWYVGNDHFFAAGNMGENRPEEKYRCFIENRDDDQYIGHSLDASCVGLLSPRTSPVMLHLDRVKPVPISHYCSLPKNFTGKWVNTAYMAVDSKIIINNTHLLETRKPDQAIEIQTTYTCQEEKGNRYMMTRTGVGGCQVYYVCFHLLPRHHNIIRYRIGIAHATKDFRLVCSWSSFFQTRDWKYDILIAQDPYPVECPIGGKFRFTQTGDVPLETRIRGGVTKSPRDQVECKQYETDFSVCPHQWYKQYTTKQILIDLDKCMTLDWRAKPIGEYDEPDYILHCIGYWRENARSFLVTYEKEDALSPFRCWVYNRVGFNRLFLSRGSASFCGVQQEPDSYNMTYGASLSLDLRENERLFDDCPLRFVDGSNPWAPVGQYGLLRSGAETLTLPLHHYGGSKNVLVLFCMFLKHMFLHVFVIE